MRREEAERQRNELWRGCLERLIGAGLLSFFGRFPWIIEEQFRERMRIHANR